MPCWNQNRYNHLIMTEAVEILQIKRIIHYLFHIGL